MTETPMEQVTEEMSRCPECYRLFMPDAGAATGFLANCGRRLANTDECEAGPCDKAKRAFAEALSSRAPQAGGEGPLREALQTLSSEWHRPWKGETRADTIANVERIAKAALAASPTPADEPKGDVRGALEDCVAIISGGISDPAQVEGALREAVAALTTPSQDEPKGDARGALEEAALDKLAGHIVDEVKRLRSLDDSSLVAHVMGLLRKPCGAVNQSYDAAWAAILAADELKAARAKLSIHELRLIIRAALAPTPADVHKGDVRGALEKAARVCEKWPDEGAGWFETTPAILMRKAAAIRALSTPSQGEAP